MRATPKQVTTNGAEGENWSKATWALWYQATRYLFREGQWCSTANYYTPRPYRNEYDRGSDKEGFVYVVMPGHKVCYWQRVDNRKRKG